MELIKIDKNNRPKLEQEVLLYWRVNEELECYEVGYLDSVVQRLTGEYYTWRSSCNSYELKPTHFCYLPSTKNL